MYWLRSVVTAGALGCAALLLPATARAAMVVASSGPSAARFPVGKKLDDAGRITLAKGDSVTVLDARGTKVLRGPGSFAVSQPGRSLPNPAYAVFTRREVAQARVGAVRAGDDGKPLSPNLWLVDVAKPGTKCLADSRTVQLWRSDTAKEEGYAVAANNLKLARFVFRSGEALIAWDMAQAPITDGASFSLQKEGSQVSQAIKFAVIANPPVDPEALALALIDRGCWAQLALLSRTLSVSRF